MNSKSNNAILSSRSPLKAGMTRLIVVLCLFPLGAWAADLPLGGKKHNNKTPIEITSDTLDVLQEQSQAIFSGHVVAIQGDVRLKAEKMTISYAKSEEGANKKSAGKDAGKNAIKKIEAVGNVFLATAGETASGATAIYDVENEEIILNDNVVLTRDKNVLKGDRLVYNFATGKSKITGDASASSDGKGKGRVRALFVPESKK